MTPDFDPRFNARADDPVNSKLAAVKLKAGVIRARVMAELERGPGTFSEIAARTGLTEPQVWRRLSDLKRVGFAQRSEEDRVGKRSGRFQAVWRIGPKWRKR